MEVTLISARLSGVPIVGFGIAQRLEQTWGILVRGYGVTQILPEVGALVAFSAAFLGIALWRFKWD
jgi:hypothetical protein